MTDRQSAQGKTFFVQNHDLTRFGSYDPRDEDIHREIMADKPHFALTETQYYSFWVPEAGIHCFNWAWFHPNLNSVSVGTLSWSGFHRNPLTCELFNFYNHHTGDVFKEHFGRASFENGFSIYAEEPGKRIRIRYDDPERGNSFNVLQTAITEQLMWPTSNHFEQVMHSTGELILRGKHYEVDCLSVRDRSWGEYRVEAPMNIPPNHWCVGALDANFSFTIVGMEDEALDPMWKGKFSVPGDSPLRFGWMIVDGEKCLVQKLSMKAEYDPDDLMPRSYIVHVEDDRGRSHTLEGRVVGATPFSAWQNMNCPICLTEWTYKGQKFTGEVQSVMFPDFIREYMK